MQNCPECEVENNDNLEACSECGCPLNLDIVKSMVNPEKNDYSPVEWIYVAIASINWIVAIVFFYKGYDKMSNYYSSEAYSSLSKNAYVGGDAYNYIINGTYSTSFFVLAIGFMLAGIAFLGLKYLVNITNKRGND